MLAKPNIEEDLIKDIIIPPRPEVLIKVSEEAKSSDPNLPEVVEALTTDVSLSGAILQVVNSPFYGLRNKISSVQQAANLLGIKKIEKLVTIVSIRSQMGGNLDLGRFWDGASETASLCGLLAKRFVEVDFDEAYMLGLFHDCGIPIMMQHFPDYKETLRECNSTKERPTTNIEVNKYGFHHAVIGYKLAKDWFLAESICDALLFHHDCIDIFSTDADTSSPVYSLLALLKVAEQISFEMHQSSRSDSNTDWTEIGEIIIDYLGLSLEDFEEMKDDMKEKMREA